MKKRGERGEEITVEKCVTGLWYKEEKEGGEEGREGIQENEIGKVERKRGREAGKEERKLGRKRVDEKRKRSTETNRPHITTKCHNERTNTQAIPTIKKTKTESHTLKKERERKKQRKRKKKHGQGQAANSPHRVNNTTGCSITSADAA